MAGQDGRTEQGRTAEVRSARGRTGRRGLRGRQHRHRRFCRISQHSALSYPRVAKRATGFCLPLGAQSIARVPQFTTKTTITIITGGDRTVSPMGAQTPSSGSSRRVWLACLAACWLAPFAPPRRSPGEQQSAVLCARRGEQKESTKKQYILQQKRTVPLHLQSSRVGGAYACTRTPSRHGQRQHPPDSSISFREMMCSPERAPGHPTVATILSVCQFTAWQYFAEWTEWRRALDWIENRTFSSGRLADEPGTRHTRESVVCQHGDHQNQVRLAESLNHALRESACCL